MTKIFTLDAARARPGDYVRSRRKVGATKETRAPAWGKVPLEAGKQFGGALSVLAHIAYHCGAANKFVDVNEETTGFRQSRTRRDRIQKLEKAGWIETVRIPGAVIKVRRRY